MNDADLDLPVREELRRAYERLYTVQRERDEWRRLAVEFKRQLNDYVRAGTTGHDRAHAAR